MAMEGKRWSDRPEVWSSQFKENIWAIIICPRGLAEQLRLIGKVVILDLGFSWCPSPPLFHNDQLRLISLTFIMRSWPGTALLFFSMPFYWFVWEISNSFSWYISLEELLCLHGSYNGVSTFLNHNKWCARDRREFPQKTTISHEKSSAITLICNCFKLSAGWLDAYNHKCDKNCEYCPTTGSLRFKRQDENVSTTALQCSEDAEIKTSLSHRLNHCTEWQVRQLSCPKQLKMFHYRYLSCCETRNVGKCYNFSVMKNDLHVAAFWEVLLMVSGLSVLLTVHFTQMAFSSSFTGVVTADNANYSSGAIPPKHRKNYKFYEIILFRAWCLRGENVEIIIINILGPRCKKVCSWLKFASHKVTNVLG